MRSLLKDAVLMKPHLLGSNYRDMIQQLMRQRVEGMCSRHGYIMPGSLSIHKVWPGRLEAVSLNGDVRFDIQYYANVCNPPVGTVLTARVVNTNKFGVLAQAGILLPDGDFVPVVEIIVTKTPMASVPGASEVDLEALKAGDEINVEIMGKKFELNDDKISVIGRAVKKGAVAASKAPATLQPLLISISADIDNGDDDAASTVEGDIDLPEGGDEDDEEEDDEEDIEEEDVEEEEDIEEEEGEDDEDDEEDDVENDKEEDEEEEFFSEAEFDEEDEAVNDDAADDFVDVPRGEA